MEHNEIVKIIQFNATRCNGCLECEKACSQVHFKSGEGGEKSAIHISTQKESYHMSVCDQCGLCIDMCPVGALIRKKNGIVWLDKTICIGCQACVGFCPMGTMRKSNVRIEPFKCISCGACVRACSKQALKLVSINIDDVKRIVHFKLGP